MVPRTPEAESDQSREEVPDRKTNREGIRLNTTPRMTITRRKKFISNDVSKFL